MTRALRLVGVAALLALAACATGGPGGGGKLDEQLQAVADATAGKGQVPVIVTLVPGTSAASYTPPGMQVAFRFVSTNAVAGAVPATGLAALAAAPEVQRVELDGEMKTLDLQ